MPILAIDFGTTTTVAAVRTEGSPPRLLAIDGSPLMPSSVFLADNGTLTVGRDADRQARLDPARYEPNPKRRIDDGEVLLGASAIPVVELIAAVLRRVADEVVRQFGSIPADVRLTHPARWGRARRRLLVDAAAAARLGNNPTLIPEPVAAATHYANLGDRTLGPDAGVAVYDLGGGTFDVAVLRRSGLSWSVLAEAGLADLGGVDFDQAIVEHLSERQGTEHRAEWDTMLAAADAANRRLRRAFETDVRECKEALSRYAQSEVPLSEPFHDELLTRAEFEELIRERLGQTVDLLAGELRRSEVPDSALAGVYLVGGSSRIPLVARLIQEQLGITPTTLDQPETSVATGALLVPAGAAASSGIVPAVPGPAAVPGPPSGSMPQQYRPVAPPVGPPGGAVPPYAPRVPTQSGQIPAQSGQVPAQSGPGRPPYGAASGPVPPVRPGPFGPNPGPPQNQGPAVGRPGGPPNYLRPPAKRSRAKWLIPSAAGLVAVAAVVAVVIATQGNKKGNAAQDSSSPPTSQSVPSSPSSATTNSEKSTSGTQFDRYFPDAGVRSYMQPTYRFIDSCETPQGTITVCQLRNGLTLEVGPNVSMGRQLSLPGATDSIVSSPHTTWKEQQWSKDDGAGELRTWLGGDQPSRPILYWDRNGAVFGIIGIQKGDVTTTNASALQSTWKSNFER